MRIERHELPPIGTNCFVLIDPDAHRAVLFDAPSGAARVAEKLLAEGFSVQAVILTHGHWDHILDAHHFNAAGIPVWAHQGDEAIIRDPSLQGGYGIPGHEAAPVVVDRWLEPGPLEVLGLDAEVRHVPGHAPGNILIYLPTLAIAVVGDAIFKRGVGRPDLPGGSMETLTTSIREQVYTLPPETRILPGHGPATTVDEERRLNPYVRA